jgi:hypothetical protein
VLQAALEAFKATVDASAEMVRKVGSPYRLLPLGLERGVHVQTTFYPPLFSHRSTRRPLYLGTTYNLLANLVAQIRTAHPAPSIYGEDGMGGRLRWFDKLCLLYSTVLSVCLLRVDVGDEMARNVGCGSSISAVFCILRVELAVLFVSFIVVCGCLR